MGSRDDAVAAHRETVRVLARPGGPLSPESPHASTHNPAWFTGAQTTAVRDELHDRLIAEYRAAHSAARDERRAIVLAGPPGAGKSTVLTEVLGEDAPGWVRVDADEFKRALLREVIDVEVPFGLSAARIASRWRESYEDALEHADGLGGRWVPSEYAREVFAGAHGRSRPEESAARLAQTCPAVMRYRVFRTLTPETDRVLEVDLWRIQRGGGLVDHKLVETMRTARAGTERTRTNRPGPGRSPRGPGVGQ